MSQLVSPKQVAQAIGVSESSLKRWCDRGLLSTIRTAGGHRRLALDDVIQYLRQSGHHLTRPELLGLPSNTDQGSSVGDRAREQIRDALIAGDEDQCRRIMFDLYLAGQTASQICDRVLAEAFHDIGDRWSCGEAQVYQERRACGFCLRILAELRSVIPTAPENAPLAIGAAPEGDPYMLPTAMVEVVFRQSQWRAQSLGSRIPLPSLLRAIQDARPQICWLSVSHIDDEQRFLDEYREFCDQVQPDVALVVGGRALSESLRRQMTYAAFCDSLQHLESFAATLKRSFSSGTFATDLASTSINKKRKGKQRPAKN